MCKYVRGEIFALIKAHQRTRSKKKQGYQLTSVLLSKDPADTQGKFSDCSFLFSLIVHVLYVS